jgi:hypothetical protein
MDMSLQVHRFPNGGYVAHGLRFNESFCKLRLSVWFSEQGLVLDCEGFDSRNRARPVPLNVRSRLGAEWGYVLATYRAQQSRA